MTMSGYKPHKSTNQPHRLQRVHSEPSISRSPTLLSMSSCTESKPPSSPNVPANSAPSISLLSESCTETVVFSEKKHRKKSNHKNSKKHKKESCSSSRKRRKSTKSKKTKKKKRTSTNRGIEDGHREEINKVQEDKEEKENVNK